MERHIAGVAEQVVEKVDGQIFGVTDDEVEEAAIRARIAFYDEEQDLVRKYMEVADNCDISVSQLDGSELPVGELSHLGNVLYNYNVLLEERLCELRYELGRLEGTLEPCCHEEDGECAISCLIAIGYSTLFLRAAASGAPPNFQGGDQKDGGHRGQKNAVRHDGRHFAQILPTA